MLEYAVLLTFHILLQTENVMYFIKILCDRSAHVSSSCKAETKLCMFFSIILQFGLNAVSIIQS